MITLYLIGHCQDFSFGFKEFDQNALSVVDGANKEADSEKGNEGIIATLSL